MGFDLTRFQLSDMTRLGAEIRGIGADATCMEDVAEDLVRYLFGAFVEAGDSSPACALVRLYLTVPLEDLDEDLQAFGRSLREAERLDPETPCLTLLASAGREAPWNDRLRSQGHRTIPLPSPAVLETIPMVSQLLKQLGVDVGAVLTPDPEVLLELEQKTYNVFHVEDARGSPHIPAQDDFVLPYGIRSVLGFGGLLPTGSVFAVLMFTTISIDRNTAELFRNAAMNAKVALLPFADGPIFRERAPG